MNKLTDRTILVVLLASVLMACGRIEVQQTSEPTLVKSDSRATGVANTITPTLEDPDAWAQNTPNNADRTTIAEIERGMIDEQNARATAFARPSAVAYTDPLPTHIPAPTDIVPVGIQPYAECGTLEWNPVFSTKNCWYEVRSGVTMQVDAGQMRSDLLGAISVYTHTPGGSTIPATLYLLPQTTNAVQIVSANYPFITVEDENGTTFTFNVETRQWVTPNGTPPATGIPATGSVLFVANSTTLNAADSAVKARIEARGYTVVVKAASAAVGSDATGKVLVVLSSTVTSSQVNTKFRDVAVPVITWDMALYDDMLMTGAGVPAEQGTTEAVTSLSIVNSTHPLAGGLSGTRTIVSVGSTLDYGTPNANAVVVARAGGNNRAVIFGYEACAILQNTTTTPAPARRVGLFLNDDTAASLTADGWTLVEAALTWALGGQPCGSAPTATPASQPTATRTATPPAATATRTPTPSGTAKTALFVVSNSSSLNAGDAAVTTRLEGLGYTVTTKSASTSAASDATGKTLVLISSSVASGDVAAKFKTVAVPVVVWEHAIYDDMALVGTTVTTDYGTASGSSLVISNAAHPLAGGLSGTVNVFSAAASMPYGVPNANAVSIAAQGSSNTKKLYFGYDRNAALVGGLTVNARRVGLFWTDGATPTTAGWTLFDAAVNWVVAP